jgi:hypothetical protein
VTPAEAIAAAELTEAEIRYRHQMAREMAEAAYERGRADGYLRAVADVKAAQHGLVLNAELEARRWGPGGREHFADARPGDYPGRGARPQAETELELEAG